MVYTENFNPSFFIISGAFRNPKGVKDQDVVQDQEKISYKTNLMQSFKTLVLHDQYTPLDLTNMELIQESKKVSAESDYTLKFTTASIFKANYKMNIRFPQGINKKINKYHSRYDNEVANGAWISINGQKEEWIVAEVKNNKYSFKFGQEEYSSVINISVRFLKIINSEYVNNDSNRTDSFEVYILDENKLILDKGQQFFPVADTAGDIIITKLNNYENTINQIGNFGIYLKSACKININNNNKGYIKVTYPDQLKVQKVQKTQPCNIFINFSKRKDCIVDQIDNSIKSPKEFQNLTASFSVQIQNQVKFPKNTSQTDIFIIQIFENDQVVCQNEIQTYIANPGKLTVEKFERSKTLVGQETIIDAKIQIKNPIPTEARLKIKLPLSEFQKESTIQLEKDSQDIPSTITQIDDYLQIDFQHWCTSTCKGETLQFKLKGLKNQNYFTNTQDNISIYTYETGIEDDILYDFTEETLQKLEPYYLHDIQIKKIISENVINQDNIHIEAEFTPFYFFFKNPSASILISFEKFIFHKGNSEISCEYFVNGSYQSNECEIIYYENSISSIKNVLLPNLCPANTCDNETKIKLKIKNVKNQLNNQIIEKDQFEIKTYFTKNNEKKFISQGKSNSLINFDDIQIINEQSIQDNDQSLMQVSLMSSITGELTQYTIDFIVFAPFASETNLGHTIIQLPLEIELTKDSTCFTSIKTITLGFECEINTEQNSIKIFYQKQFKDLITQTISLIIANVKNPNSIKPTQQISVKQFLQGHQQSVIKQHITIQKAKEIECQLVRKSKELNEVTNVDVVLTVNNDINKSIIIIQIPKAQLILLDDFKVKKSAEKVFLPIIGKEETELEYIVQISVEDPCTTCNPSDIYQFTLLNVKNPSTTKLYSNNLKIDILTKELFKIQQNHQSYISPYLSAGILTIDALNLSNRTAGNKSDLTFQVTLQNKVQANSDIEVILPKSMFYQENLICFYDELEQSCQITENNHIQKIQFKICQNSCSANSKFTIKIQNLINQRYKQAYAEKVTISTIDSHEEIIDTTKIVSNLIEVNNLNSINITNLNRSSSKLGEPMFITFSIQQSILYDEHTVIDVLIPTTYIDHTNYSNVEVFDGQKQLKSLANIDGDVLIIRFEEICMQNCQDNVYNIKIANLNNSHQLIDESQQIIFKSYHDNNQMENNQIDITPKLQINSFLVQYQRKTEKINDFTSNIINFTVDNKHLKNEIIKFTFQNEMNFYDKQFENKKNNESLGNCTQEDKKIISCQLNQDIQHQDVKFSFINWNQQTCQEKLMITSDNKSSSEVTVINQPYIINNQDIQTVYNKSDNSLEIKVKSVISNYNKIKVTFGRNFIFNNSIEMQSQILVENHVYQQEFTSSMENVHFKFVNVKFDLISTEENYVYIEQYQNDCVFSQSSFKQVSQSDGQMKLYFEIGNFNQNEDANANMLIETNSSFNGKVYIIFQDDLEVKNDISLKADGVSQDIIQRSNSITFDLSFNQRTKLTFNNLFNTQKIPTSSNVQLFLKQSDNIIAENFVYSKLNNITPLKAIHENNNNKITISFKVPNIIKPQSKIIIQVPDTVFKVDIQQNILINSQKNVISSSSLSDIQDIQIILIDQLYSLDFDIEVYGTKVLDLTNKNQFIKLFIEENGVNIFNSQTYLQEEFNNTQIQQTTFTQQTQLLGKENKFIFELETQKNRQINSNSELYISFDKLNASEILQIQVKDKQNNINCETNQENKGFNSVIKIKNCDQQVDNLSVIVKIKNSFEEIQQQQNLLVVHINDGKQTFKMIPYTQKLEMSTVKLTQDPQLDITTNTVQQLITKIILNQQVQPQNYSKLILNYQTINYDVEYTCTVNNLNIQCFILNEGGKLSVLTSFMHIDQMIEQIEINIIQFKVPQTNRDIEIQSVHYYDNNKKIETNLQLQVNKLIIFNAEVQRDNTKDKQNTDLLIYFQFPLDLIDKNVNLIVQFLGNNALEFNFESMKCNKNDSNLSCTEVNSNLKIDSICDEQNLCIQKQDQKIKISKFQNPDFILKEKSIQLYLIDNQGYKIAQSEGLQIQPPLEAGLVTNFEVKQKELVQEQLTEIEIKFKSFTQLRSNQSQFQMVFENEIFIPVNIICIVNDNIRECSYKDKTLDIINICSDPINNYCQPQEFTVRVNGVKNFYYKELPRFTVQMFLKQENMHNQQYYITDKSNQLSFKNEITHSNIVLNTYTMPYNYQVSQNLIITMNLESTLLKNSNIFIRFEKPFTGDIVCKENLSINKQDMALVQQEKLLKLIIDQQYEKGQFVFEIGNIQLQNKQQDITVELMFDGKQMANGSVNLKFYENISNTCTEIDNCDSCVEEDNKQKCLQCKAPSSAPFLSDNQCTETCQLYSQNKCFQCHSNCLTCTGGASNQCLTCKQDFNFQKGSCISSCAPNLTLQNGVCVTLNCELKGCNSCADDYCYDCSQDSQFDGKCVKQCLTGYFSKENKCVKCDKSCGSCVSETKCLKCNQSFETQLLQNYRCVKECKEGNFQENKDCLTCSKSCSKCFDLNTCQECEEKNLLQDGVCIGQADKGLDGEDPTTDCIPKCQQCNGNQCESCQDNMLVQQNVCVDTCSDNYYKEENYCFQKNNIFSIGLSLTLVLLLIPIIWIIISVIKMKSLVNILIQINVSFTMAEILTKPLLFIPLFFKDNAQIIFPLQATLFLSMGLLGMLFKITVFELLEENNDLLSNFGRNNKIFRKISNILCYIFGTITFRLPQSKLVSIPKFKTNELQVYDCLLQKSEKYAYLFNICQIVLDVYYIYAYAKSVDQIFTIAIVNSIMIVVSYASYLLHSSDKVKKALRQNK